MLTGKKIHFQCSYKSIGRDMGDYVLSRLEKVLKMLLFCTWQD